MPKTNNNGNGRLGSGGGADVATGAINAYEHDSIDGSE